MSSPSAQGAHTSHPPGSSRPKVYGLYVAGSPTQLCRDPTTSPTQGTRHYNRVRTNVTVSRSNPNMVATSGHYSQIMTPGIATLLGPRILTKLQQVGPQMAPGALRHLTNRPPRPLGSGTAPHQAVLAQIYIYIHMYV